MSLKVSEINLFFELNGIRTHVKIEATGDDPVAPQIAKLTKSLREFGANPEQRREPMPKRGNSNSQEKIFNTERHDIKCPNCLTSPIREAKGPGKWGNPYHSLKCPKCGWKRDLMNYPFNDSKSQEEPKDVS